MSESEIARLKAIGFNNLTFDLEYDGDPYDAQFDEEIEGEYARFERTDVCVVTLYFDTRELVCTCTLESGEGDFNMKGFIE